MTPQKLAHRPVRWSIRSGAIRSTFNCEPVWPSGTVGMQKDLGLIPLRLSLLFGNVVCGHCLVTLSLTINDTLNGSHRCPSQCRSHSGGDSEAIGI